jgi:hypothetical protein
MGEITRPVNLGDLISHYNIKNYFETGVGTGHSFRKMKAFNLKQYGIELDERFIPIYEREFPSDTIIMGYTKDRVGPLVEVLDDNPTLFWLDAHFPNSDFHGAPYDSEKDKDIRVPLETELKTITESRDISKDVFILDDLRIYKDLPNIRWAFKETTGDQFMHDMLQETHILREVHADQGYLVCLPKSCNLSDVEIEEEIINR